VAACLVAAGQFGGAADQQLADGKTAGAAAMSAEAPADLISFLETAQKAVIRYFSL
jgi:hypothetical protein